MKPGAIVAVLLSVIGMAAVVMAFQTNASKYVSVKEAKASPGGSQHLSGLIVQGTMESSSAKRYLKFVLIDEDGETIPVVMHKLPPANLSAAPKVVAVGGVKNGEFVATDIITKCPSKYESEKK
ncbi:MAG: cytochrome c maturation protein CcmE [Chthonomonadaceae bacterium]|jgi:cytochrome c-type biogenesis protein CcmE|nr:cytochrome c maturation protein CcmE [Chthonomonadaceae bacterium]